MSRLTKKQEAFALAYIKTGNASEAYRQAGYTTQTMAAKTVNEAASRLLKNSKVAARIDELRAPALKAAGLTVERELREVARISGSDLRRLMNEDGSAKLPHEWDDDTAAAVASVEFDKDTGKISKLKLWDKNSGLEKSMKHLGLYREDNKQRAESLVLNVGLVKAR